MINNIKPYVLVKNLDAGEVSILTKEEWIANTNSNLDEASQHDTILDANLEGIRITRGNNLILKRRKC